MTEAQSMQDAGADRAAFETACRAAMSLALRDVPAAEARCAELVAMAADVDASSRVDINDYHRLHQAPRDVTGDGFVDEQDLAAIERFIRRFERMPDRR